MLLKHSRRSGFVLIDAIVGLALVSAGCILVAAAHTDMNRRIAIEQQRTSQFRKQYEKETERLGLMFHEQEPRSADRLHSH